MELKTNASKSIFTDSQLIAIEKINLPHALVFKTATEYDTKYIQTKSNSWRYHFSGRNHHIKFTGSPEEIKLTKYIFASFVRTNSPSGLDSFNYIIENLIREANNLGGFSFDNSVKVTKKVKSSNRFYFYIFSLKVLCRLDFPEFPYDRLEDFEFIPRPRNDSWLVYQNIDNVLSGHEKNMISRGLKETCYRIKKNDETLTDRELMDCTILGLCYEAGPRPVQLARLSGGDFSVDTTRKEDDFKRYSLRLPYAKLHKLTPDKVLISLSPEMGTILTEYKRRFSKEESEQFFDVGHSAVDFVNKSINRQMLRFSPKETQQAVSDDLMVPPIYSTYDFRHNIGHTMAMRGHSAEEIAYILGHSSLVTAKHYIMATPELALIRAQALGTNPVWQNMIAMMLTGHIVSEKDWSGLRVSGVIAGKLHAEVGGCSRPHKQCPFSELRSCYGCFYFQPFSEGNHEAVRASVMAEISDLVELSDSVGNSRNPLIQVHESTKYEIEAVIARCKLHQDSEHRLLNE